MQIVCDAKEEVHYIQRLILVFSEHCSVYVRINVNSVHIDSDIHGLVYTVHIDTDIHGLV